MGSVDLPFGTESHLLSRGSRYGDTQLLASRFRSLLRSSLGIALLIVRNERGFHRYESVLGNGLLRANAVSSTF
jgi:hypothetical protein